MNVNVNTWKWCSVYSGTELLKRIFLYAQWCNFWLHAAYTDNTLLYIRYTGYSTWFVNCIIVPWLLLFSLCRMKPWWGPCSCLRTWCRNKRRWRRQRHGGKKWEGLVWVRVCECGWMHMCNTSDLSSSSRSVSSSWFWVERPPPDTRWLERRDLDWKCFTHSLSPAEVSPHEHKVTDVTDLDTSLSVLSRRFGLLTIRVLPTSRELLFNQWNFFFFFSIQNKCMLLQRFWFIFQIFAMGIWP